MAGQNIYGRASTDGSKADELPCYQLHNDEDEVILYIYMHANLLLN